MAGKYPVQDQSSAPRWCGPASSSTSCVTLGKLLTQPGLHLLMCNMGNDSVLKGVAEGVA